MWRAGCSAEARSIDEERWKRQKQTAEDTLERLVEEELLAERQLLAVKIAAAQHYAAKEAAQQQEDAVQ